MENIRIDKGVKRGPRTRKGLPTKPSHPADLGSWKIPETLNPDEVIRQYLTAPTTSSIAKQYGLSRKALTAWLRKSRPQEWKEAQIIRAYCRKEDGEIGIDESRDALSLARAREQLKGAQFDLQALEADYQPKQHVTVDINVDLGERLMRAEQRVIEGEHTVITQDSDKPLNDKD